MTLPNGKSELPEMDAAAHEMLTALVEIYRKNGDPITLRSIYKGAEFLKHHQDYITKEQGEEYWTEYQQDIEDLLCTCNGVGFHAHVASCPATEVLQ